MTSWRRPFCGSLPVFPLSSRDPGATEGGRRAGILFGRVQVALEKLSRTIARSEGLSNRELTKLEKQLLELEERIRN